VKEKSRRDNLDLISGWGKKKKKPKENRDESEGFGPPSRKRTSERGEGFSLVAADGVGNRDKRRGEKRERTSKTLPDLRFESWEVDRNELRRIQEKRMQL